MRMDTADILKKVRQIEIQTGKLVTETFAGEYLSAFKGQGIEFAEVREYTPGDDVRSIDWNVTARSNTPFVKKFNEEAGPILNKSNRIAAVAYFYFVHAKYINALYAVISMVEFTNVNAKDNFEIPRKWRQPKMFGEMEDLFAGSACKSLFIDNISMNKNYCDVYGRAMESIAEEKIIRELCSTSKKKQEKALAFIYMYFTGVLSGADGNDADFSAALSAIFQKSLKE